MYTKLFLFQFYYPPYPPLGKVEPKNDHKAKLTPKEVKYMLLSLYNFILYDD